MTEEMTAKLEKLAELQKQLYAFRYATSSIYLDGATVAPKDTEEGRGEALGILTGYMYDLSTKAETIELLEYLKIKIKEREFHVKAIFDAYNFVQKTEIAREMLVGADRRERVNQTVNSKRLTKIMGYLNLNNKIKTED